MRALTRIAMTAAAIALLAIPAGAQPHQVFFAWAPKPAEPTGWTAPMKPVWRLKEILASHQGQAAWDQPIVRDKDYDGDYVQMAPGTKTRPQFWADDRILFIVWSGQIRFNIQGQAPFVASKGFLVDIPYRAIYSMEVVGDQPSLHFQVSAAGRHPYFPATDGDTAPTAPGIAYTKVSYNLVADPYTDKNVPTIDFEKDYVNNPNPPKQMRGFVADDHDAVNIIRGMGVPTPPDNNKGHFHIDHNEFWFIAEGKIDYLMEGQKLFTAEAGDVAYAPAGRWHRASFAPGQMDTRIAINRAPA